MKHINKDHKSNKNSTVYTPEAVVDFIHRVLIKQSNLKVNTVLEPAVGSGALINDMDCYKIAVDIEEQISRKKVDEIYIQDFETFYGGSKIPDLIIMNPPFNGHPHRKLYPEVFINKCFDLYGYDIPMIAIIPTGWRLNQRIKSKRWRHSRDNHNITSIVTLPLDIFEGVLFHTEIVVFNIEGLKSHYFLDNI